MIFDSEPSLVLVLFISVCLSIAFLFLHFVDRLLISQRTRRALVDSIVLSDNEPPWSVRDDVTFRNPEAANDTINLRVVHYRRAFGKGNGVRRPVNVNRVLDRKYVRKLLPYRRKDVVYVPSQTDDAVRCDDWSTESGSFVPCTISEGVEACFRCVESRRFVRRCVRVKRPITVTLSDDKQIVIPANASADQGWCLPASFKQIRVDNEGKLRPPFDATRNCNPNTGDWVLARLYADGKNAAFDTSYNWICRCRYPNLVTNLGGDLTSDCMQPVGCKPNGQLDDRARAGLVDPYRNGTCVCGHGYTSDFIANVGPVCIPMNVVDYGLDNLYNDSIPSSVKWTPIPLHLIDQTFVDLFPVQPSSKLRLPDPCDFDAYTGEWLAGNGCQLRSSVIDGKERAMCYPSNANHVAFISETDYLLNNAGQYPNSCLYTGSVDHGLADGAERILGQFVLSWWNGKNFPDVGQVVNVDLLESSKRERLNEIYDVLSSDRSYSEWYVDKVNKYDPIAMSRLSLRFKASKFYDQTVNTRMLLFYNVNLLSEVVSYDRATDEVAFFRQVFAPFGRPGTGATSDIDGIPNDEEQPVLLANVNDLTINHVRLLAGYRSDTQKYVKQTDEDYRRFPTLITVESGSNCHGSGALLESTVYLNYEPLQNDRLSDKHNGVQWFARGPDAVYPATPSSFFCRTCSRIKYDGTIVEAYANEIPKMWPVVLVGKNRNLFPNPVHPTFDATVQVFVTTNFVVVSSNAYSGNFMNYQSIGNRRRFFSDKPMTIQDYTEQ